MYGESGDSRISTTRNPVVVLSGFGFWHSCERRRRHSPLGLPRSPGALRIADMACVPAVPAETPHPAGGVQRSFPRRSCGVRGEELVKLAPAPPGAALVLTSEVACTDVRTPLYGAG